MSAKDAEASLQLQFYEHKCNQKRCSADGWVSTAQKLFGDFDPKLAELTDNVLFADVWERPELSKRDRSLITVAALIALNRPEQLRAHLQRARR